MSRNGNVRRRVSPNGIERWEARWRDDKGKERQRSFRTKQAALKFQAERKADVLRGLVRDEDRAADAFSVYSDKWIAAKRTEVRARTAEGYDKDLRVHVLPFFGDMPVGRITTSDVLRWVEQMTEKRIAGHSLSPRTIKVAHWCIVQVLDLAIQHGAVHINHARGVKTPSRHTVAPAKPFRHRTLSPQEQPRLVAAMDQLDITGMDALVTAVLLGTGLRAAELAGLEVGDFSPLHRTLSVARTKRYLPGKTQPEVGEPKSEKSRRTIPVPKPTADALTAWLDQHPRRHETSAPLFPSSDGMTLDWTRPIDPNVFRRLSFWPAVVHAGLDPDLRLHDLRHTFGSTLVEAGVPIEKVSRLMGHSTISITMDIYVHTNTAAYHDEVDAALPSLMTSQSQAAQSDIREA